MRILSHWEVESGVVLVLLPHFLADKCFLRFYFESLLVLNKVELCLHKKFEINIRLFKLPTPLIKTLFWGYLFANEYWYNNPLISILSFEYFVFIWKILRLDS